MNTQQEPNGPNTGPPTATMDSLTLGQLRTMISSQPKPKQWWYDFSYDDEDTVMNELDELYSYVEMPQVAENLKAWQGYYGEEWTKSTAAKRRLHVEMLLDGLEQKDAVVRFTNSRRLFYIVQGTFAETVSPEHQLHWIFENCKIVRAANGVSCVIEALKIASHKQDLIASLTDADIAQLNISQQDKSDLLEEVLTEISVYFGILYHLIEVFKGHDDFADELMSLDPPLPVYLFNLVAALRDKNSKGYPIKKLLLLLWKSLLACFGGIRDYARVKALSRELAGLPADGPFQKGTPVPFIKSSPLDIEAFRQETAVKYPTFTPPPPPSVVSGQEPETASVFKHLSGNLSSKLAQAYSPIPVRHHYHHDDLEGHPGLVNSNPHPFPQPPGTFNRSVIQPSTPAPSPPPPNAKPKKQQYQTDQSRPFLFPFSKAQGRDARLVPFAIDEAENLYNRHMYVSLALSQMWRTREDCMTFESGLERMPGTEDEFEPSTFTSKDPETAEPLPDLALLDAKIAEAEIALEKAETVAEKRKARERREDLLRLKRVEQTYSAVLPVLSNWVLVLLKLLLATVSAASNAAPQPSTSPFQPGVSPPEQPNLPPPTVEETDVTRHREITSKAVSAILLVVLRWFKVSHVMKFHHLGQLLLDTNCLLLLLKLFGLQEVSTSLISKADVLDQNFFRYCFLNFAKNPQHIRPEDNMLKPPRHTIVKQVTLPNGQLHEEEVEMVTDFSWRNFFATINFAKIMQKLSKNRSHRIWMLVQYKSSAVLKRMLRVQHPMLQLHLLKLIKSQVPFCGRKWRQSNMKVITAIYLNCRPDLRDEWLTGGEVDDVSDASAQEMALRHLVKFYNNRRYGTSTPVNQQGPMHKRSGSISNHIEGLHPGPELSSIIRPLGTPNTVEADVFPPARSQAPDPSIFLPYIPEDISFEEEYEEYISDLGLPDDSNTDPSLFVGTSAWSRFPAQFAQDIDGISDSESIVSIGDLGDEARDGGRDDGEVVDENLNNWEHMSPKTMAALPKSPAGRRSSSGGGGLRPVVPAFGLDDGTAIDLDDDDDELPGPAPREQSEPFAGGAGVDEVEYAYGV
ncbi:N1221-domain-containing protein [Marasmius fiardii PR-910]|nr:N1221-domain-containing protein [Marasmius fiardii PR-910]